ncbi:MAG TPA: hypothetical protein VIJ18_18190 [Microbacteriaceae bacterium]
MSEHDFNESTRAEGERERKAREDELSAARVRREDAWHARHDEYLALAQQLLTATELVRLHRELNRNNYPHPVWLLCRKGNHDVWHRSGHGVYLVERGGTIELVPAADPETGPQALLNGFTVLNAVPEAKYGAIWQWRCATCGERNERSLVALLNAVVGTISSGHPDGREFACRMAIVV